MATAVSPPLPFSSSDEDLHLCNAYIAENNHIDNEVDLHLRNAYIAENNHIDNEVDIDLDSNPPPLSVKRKKIRTSSHYEYSKIEDLDFTVNAEIVHKKSYPPEHIKPTFIQTKKLFKEYRIVGHHVAEFQRRHDTGTPTLKLISPTIGGPGFSELDPPDIQKILDSLTEASRTYSKTILDLLIKNFKTKKDKFNKALDSLKELNSASEFLALRNKIVAEGNFDIDKRCHSKPIYENSPTVKILVNGITHSINNNNLLDFKKTITSNFVEPIEIPVPYSPNLPASEILPTVEDEEEDAPFDNSKLKIVLKNITEELKSLNHTVNVLKQDTTYLKNKSDLPSSVDENRERNLRAAPEMSTQRPGKSAQRLEKRKNQRHYSPSRNYSSPRNHGSWNYGSRNSEHRKYELRDYQQRNYYSRNPNSWDYTPPKSYNNRNYNPPRPYYPPRNEHPRNGNSRDDNSKYEDRTYVNYRYNDSRNRDMDPRNRDTYLDFGPRNEPRPHQGHNKNF